MSVFVSSMETRVSKLEAEIAILKRQVCTLMRRVKHDKKDRTADDEKVEEETCTIT